MFHKQKKLTRTVDTIARYEGLFDRFTREGLERRFQLGRLQIAITSDEEWAVEAFLATCPEWAEATERLYLAAMKHALDSRISQRIPYSLEAKRKLLGMTNPKEDVLGYFVCDEARAEQIAAWEERQTERKKALETLKRSRKAGKTSTQKAKKLSSLDIEAVFRKLDLSKSKWKNDTKEWFHAGILTGLRPSEWAHSRLDQVQKRLMLIVDNGKNTNGRSFGPDREIDISGLNFAEKLLIKRHLERASAHQKQQSYKAWYDRCRRLMHTISRGTPSKRKTHPTLYSARHRFAATAKSTLPKREVAALMGHGSESTATRHYARKDSSNGLLRVKPSQRSVQAVAIRNGLETEAPDFPKTSARAKKSENVSKASPVKGETTAPKVPNATNDTSALGTLTSVKASEAVKPAIDLAASRALNARHFVETESAKPPKRPYKPAP
ncbi:hypothetical protein QTI51_37210 [Variovorax sp. J22G73]|uniref:hypothetical protein n=1 Tax=unclassified Variovorax TaxID=663243 RepID=UPI002574EC7B|nr:MULTISPECIES: hypothetical protein [unclassified Variovorax]MDM0010172.1 hypothetical protein [Variovorax sp. J22R203]MDM0102966.1 hypothetical protein [Variovorax sp. J22G73]